MSCVFLFIEALLLLGPSNLFLEGDGKTHENGKNLSNLLEEQIKLEKEIANKFKILEGRVDSIAARLLIREIQLDTKKHAEILEAALKVIGGPEPFWEMTIDVEADKKTVKRELEEHIKAEGTMIRQIDEEMRKTKP